MQYVAGIGYVDTTLAEAIARAIMIQALQREVQELQREVRQMRVERDAAVRQARREAHRPNVG